MKQSGIYVIRHKESGKLYVGSAVNLRRRWNIHCCKLRKNRHHSVYLQNTWNKYGSNALEFVVIEEILNVENLLAREQYWLDVYKSYNRKFGYNVALIAGSNLGIRKSKAQCLQQHKIGKTRVKNPVEYKRLQEISKLAKFSFPNNKPNGMLGKVHSKETKLKIRLSRIGYKQSLEHIKNASDARRGWKHTKEQKQKWSVQRKGSTPWNKNISITCINCKNCGYSFSFPRFKQRRFCSRTCANIFNHKRI